MPDFRTAEFFHRFVPRLLRQRQLLRLRRRVILGRAVHQYVRRILHGAG
jgi:hypothetical protein